MWSRTHTAQGSTCSGAVGAGGAGRAERVGGARRACRGTGMPHLACAGIARLWLAACRLVWHPCRAAGGGLVQHAHGALHLPRRRSLGRTATRCTRQRRRPLPTGRAECVIPIPLPLEWRRWIPEPLAAKIVKIDTDV